MCGLDIVWFTTILFYGAVYESDPFPLNISWHYSDVMHVYGGVFFGPQVSFSITTVIFKLQAPAVL